MKTVRAVHATLCLLIGLGFAANTYAGTQNVPEPDMIVAAAAAAFAVVLLRKFRRK